METGGVGAHRRAGTGETRRVALVVAAVATALLATLGASGCESTLARSVRKPFERPPSVVEPRIVPASDTHGTTVVSRQFDFEDRKIELSVPVDRAVYAGAQTAQKSAIFYGKKPPNWVPDYYRAFIDEAHETDFYSALLDALHQVRAQDALDRSRYAELVIAMCQGLDYRSDPGSLAPKFPIETFADGYGDCDDKTLLAAALLARDGFDVAVLLFQPEKHVALGIRAPGLEYKDTGYAYVEMTGPSLVGVPADNFTSGIKLTSDPVVIGVGKGTDVYAAGDEIRSIRQRLELANSTLERLRDEIAAQNKKLADERASMDADLQALRRNDEPHALQTAIDQYNKRVNAFNSHAAELNALTARYNSIAELVTYAAEHQTARQQIHDRLRSAKL